LLRHSRSVVALLVSLVVAPIVLSSCGHEATGPSESSATPTLTALNSSVGAPIGWFGFMGSPARFVLGPQTASVHSGTQAAYIGLRGATGTDSTFANMSQAIQAGAYLGKRVRLSAWVRPVGVTLPVAAAVADGQSPPVSGLWMRVDGYGSTLAFDNMQTRPVVGSTDWQQVSVVLDVPSYALGIAFGALFSGSGQLLVDDVALETVSTSTPLTDLLKGEITNTVNGDSTVAYYSRSPAAPVNLGFEVKAAAGTAMSQRLTLSPAETFKRPAARSPATWPFPPSYQR